jgi:hypothetical protein
MAQFRHTLTSSFLSQGHLQTLQSFFWGRSGTESIITAAISLPNVLALDDVDFGAIGRMNYWQGRPNYMEKACYSTAPSTTDPTGLDPGSNPGRRSGKPATNRLSYGMANLLI